MKKILFILLLLLSFSCFNFQTDAMTSTCKAGIVDSNGSNLNVRSNTSTSSSIITKLADKSYLTVISTSGNWHYVEYKENSFGYVHKDYVNIVSTNVKKVTTGGSNLNVRYGPSTSYYQFEKIKDNDYVVVLSTTNGWSNVLFEGNKVGYVSSNYLNSLYTYPEKKLSVDSYKQFDSRWANLKLGTSGKTMREIGCLTTAMSMVESYRTNTKITPDVMRSKLSYTSSGDMYWPNNYSFSYTSNYLSTIYNMLKSNKPVIIGFKNNSGGQHWVVVTGFVGGNNLSASNFLVNDPGSSSNTRLNQVIASYPIFYKLAYYN